MHMTIGAIVYADSKEQAVARATGVFEELVSEHTGFDYFSILDRQGDEPFYPCLAESVDGRTIIGRMMEWATLDFERGVASVKKMINNFTAEELMEERPADTRPLHEKQGFDALIRHRFYKLGQYRGGNVWLYDFQCEGIRNWRHVHDALSKWGGEASAIKNDPMILGSAWIVPADVHM
jgi:hypothetical protein